MKFETKYGLNEIVDFGTEKGVIVEISFKHESEPEYTVQYLNPFTKFNITMTESAVTTSIAGGKQIVDIVNRFISDRVKARIEELGDCGRCKDGKGKCPAYRGEDVTLLNCGDMNCWKASVIRELRDLLSDTRTNTEK